jgi:four helix bundle protein
MRESGNVEIAKPSFAKHYSDLEVFELAFQLSMKLHHLSLNFPKYEQYALADQMRRSSKAICANIAEGFGKQRQSKNEFRRFLSMAIGSCTEVQVWLRYAGELEYISKNDANLFRHEYDKVERMLYSLHAKIK